MRMRLDLEQRSRVRVGFEEGVLGVSMSARDPPDGGPFLGRRRTLPRRHPLRLARLLAVKYHFGLLGHGGRAVTHEWAIELHRHRRIKIEAWPLAVARLALQVAVATRSARRATLMRGTGGSTAVAVSISVALAVGTRSARGAVAMR